MSDKIRKGETVTAFTMRRIRNDIIEACAMVCDNRVHGDDAGSSHYAPYDAEAKACAQAIRALKDL
jgi:hypothetical protein